MNTALELTTQELLYKISRNNNFHINSDDFEKLKKDMRKVNLNSNTYEFKVDKSSHFENYAAYYIIDKNSNGKGWVFRADSYNVCDFVFNTDEVYLYNCHYEIKKKDNSKIKTIIGIIILLIILLYTLFSIESLFGTPDIILAGPVVLIGIYQIAKWLIPNFTKKKKLSDKDINDLERINYILGENEKELEIDVKNKIDKYYEEKHQKDKICVPKAKEKK